MKKLIIALALCLTAFSFSSCNTQNIKLGEIATYAEPTAFVASYAVLRISKTEEDRQAKAAIMLKVSESIANLSDEEAPTVEEFEKLILDLCPKKPHWTIFAGDLARVYSLLHAKYQNKLEVVHLIAEGIKKAAVANHVGTSK